MSLRLTETRLELRIAAPPARVWEVLTADMGRWWPEPFLVSGAGAKMQLELFPGGRLFEVSDGGGLLWATVQGFRRSELLQVAGDLFPAWGGPSRWLGTWKLAADGDATVVRFEDVRMGATPDEVAGSLDRGWTYLLECLRTTVEGQPRPEWTG